MWMFCVCLVAYNYDDTTVNVAVSPENNLYESSYCNSLDISMLSLMSLHVHSLDFDLLEEIFS